MSVAPFSSVLPSSSTRFTVFDIPGRDLPGYEMKMYPGGYSNAGFLGPKERLKDVCIKDLTTLVKLGISCDRVSEAMEQLIQTAKKTSQNAFQPVMVGKFQVSGVGLVSNAPQECPFGPIRKPCHTGKGIYCVENTTTHEAVAFSPLSIDMIRDHAFFQGTTSYRVDPAILCRILEIQPDVGLKKEKVKVHTWKYVSCETISKENEAAAKQHAKAIEIIDEFATAYVGIPCEELEDLLPKKTAPVESGPFSIEDFDQFKYEDDDEKSSKPEVEKSYCHIFNHKKRKEPFCPEVNGAPLDRSIEISCVHVFALETKEVARVSPQGA